MQKIIGESSSLAEALDHVSLLAPINRPVLVIGERGSGKELIAERLHYLSARWDNSLDKVNCAAISETLLDSELFGHEVGAFTGAVKAHIGRFERADGGTLFLDELATLPLRIQEKILRVIEYGEFERLGSQSTIKVDIRIVGATHADLPTLADQGKFRHDLLDRLAFDVINVPPLRDRKEDIPELVEYFATRMAMELEWGYYSGFTQKALSQLLNHPWPGNIRELRNVVERSLNRWGDRDTPIDTVWIYPFSKHALSSEALDKDAHNRGGEKGNLNPGNLLSMTKDGTGDLPTQSFNFKQRVNDHEISLIQHALLLNQYNQKSTADYMNISYHQLRGLIKKYQDSLKLK